MGLRDIGATLPPGFRFYPSDEELVCHYLYKKIANEESLKGTLVEIDLHVCEPWQLPDVAKLNATEWYFFSFRDRKYATGFRTNRATVTGYWKATGKDRTVHNPTTREIVGMRKTLVFYRNRAPNGIKTGWIMHEFRLETPHMPPKEDWVLCRVFQRSKTENGDKLSPPYMFEATPPTTINAPLNSPPPATTTVAHHQSYHPTVITTSTSPSSASTPHYHHPHNDYSHSTPSLLHLLQYPNNHHHQETSSNNSHAVVSLSGIGSKPDDDDDYSGFFWDAAGNIELEGGVDGVSSRLVDHMRFEMMDHSNFL